MTPQRAPQSVDWKYVIGWVNRYGLAIWFACMTAARLVVLARFEDPVFFDARLYLEATSAWLRGDDPWLVQLHGTSFAAPPMTLLLIAPFAALPDPLGLMALAALVVTAAISTVRILRLPWWWLAFPPLVESAVVGNVNALLLPLILHGAGSLAILLKAYAFVPIVLLRRWRDVVIAGVLVLGTAPLLPYASFIGAYPSLGNTLAKQTMFDLPWELWLASLPIAILCLWRIGVRRGAWLAMPAVWPTPQPYYMSMAMPSMSRVACALVILPIPGAGLLALVGVLVADFVRQHRIMRPWVAISRRTMSDDVSSG